MNVDVNDFLLHYPQINEPNFQREINRMNEFHSLRLSPSETLASKKGTYLQHQEMARRLINNETPYSKMLFEHEPGTGKTCIITAISEWNISEKNRLAAEKNKNIKSTKKEFFKTIKSPLIFVANQTQEQNLTKMIAHSCLPEKYENKIFDEDDDELLTDRQKRNRIHNLVARDYQFETFRQFSSTILGYDKVNNEVIIEMDDKTIKNKFSDRLIIIDEAHHLRLASESNKKDNNTYNAFWKLLHVAENIKVILLTGTPESDKVEDFAYVMNLVLPEDEQLPTKNYEKIMFKNEKLTEEGQDMLKKAITGRVSYLRAQEDNETKLIENGRINPWKEGHYKEWIKDAGYEHIKENSYPWTESIKLVPLRMSDFQEEIVRDSEYKQNIFTRKNKEGELVEISGGEGGAFLNFEKDASIIVWPDGSYGKEGFEKYVDIDKHKEGGKLLQDIRGGKVAKQITTFRLKKEARPVIENLGKYSIKYHKIIQTLKEIDKTGGKIFIFAPALANGGLTLLTLFMQKILGYTEGTMNSLSKKKQPRYIILSGATGETDVQLVNLIDIFNDPKNARGEYINVVMGTEKIAEGITLKGITKFISFRADHRLKYITQAEKRGYRLGSHDQLEPHEKVYEINRLVTAYSDDDGNFLPDLTGDIKIYKQVETKDLLIKTQRRFRKIHAVDCVWNYARNVQSNDKDFSKECEKQKCNYICAESIPEFINKDKKIWEYNYPKEYLNYNNYNLLYSEKDRRDIVQELQTLFQEKNEYSFEELNNLLPKYNSLLLMQTLEEIVSNDISMYTRYGTIAYLHENNSHFYINNHVSSLDYKNELGKQYTNNLYVSNRRSLDDLLDIINNENDMIIRDFCNAKTNEEKIKILNSLSGRLLQDFVEMYHVTLYKGKIYENNQFPAFFNKFSYKMNDGNIVHYLEYKDFNAETYGLRSVKLTVGGKLRYFGKNGVWMYVNSVAEKKKYIKEIEDKREWKRTDKFNEIGMFGKRNPTGKKELFQLVKNEPMEIVCLELTKEFLITVTAKLNINFVDIDVSGLPEIPTTEFYKDDKYDVIQNANVTRMINILKVSKLKVCNVISEQIKTKLIEAIKLSELSQNKLTKEEMTDIILEYDLFINDIRIDYPSLEELKKLGYKGPEVAPHTMRTLMYMYIIWNQKSGKPYNVFKSSVKKYLEAVNTINNKFKHKSTGTVCNTLKKKDMIRTILDVSSPDFAPKQNMTREEMLTFINNIKTGSGLIEEEVLLLDNDKLNTIVYIFKGRDPNKDVLCRYLHDVLSKLGYMYDV